MEIKTHEEHHKIYTPVTPEGELMGRLDVWEDYYEDGYCFNLIKVYPDYRRQGLARTLINHVLDVYGHKEIILCASPFMDKPTSLLQLINFYREFGFEVYGDSSDNCKDMIRYPIDVPLD